MDGVHANGFGDVRALIGTDTFELYAGLFHVASGDMSLYDYLNGKLGMLRVSTRVPAVAATAQKGIAVLTAQGQPVTVPVWKGVELITDPYTQAAKGQTGCDGGNAGGVAVPCPTARPRPPRFTPSLS